MKKKILAIAILAIATTNLFAQQSVTYKKRVSSREEKLQRAINDYEDAIRAGTDYKIRGLKTVLRNAPLEFYKRRKKITYTKTRDYGFHFAQILFDMAKKRNINLHRPFGSTQIKESKFTRKYLELLAAAIKHKQHMYRYKPSFVQAIRSLFKDEITKVHKLKRSIDDISRKHKREAEKEGYGKGTYLPLQKKMETKRKRSEAIRREVARMINSWSSILGYNLKSDLIREINWKLPFDYKLP
jgi:hypothetical protein